jgi:hypothetical protein
MTELDAFRSVDFNWTRQLRSIWRDQPYHVPSLHQRPLDEIVDYFRLQTRDPDPPNEPLGRVIVGPAGYGKTHLIGELRRRVWAMDGWFVLLDLIGIKDFWSSVALGFLNSLQVRRPDTPKRHTQYDLLILRLADFLEISGDLIRIAERSPGQPEQMTTEMANAFTRALASRFSNDIIVAYRDVVTALILLISIDLDHHSIAHGWLQGMNFDPAEVRPLGFRGENSPLKVVQGLSWVMSIVGPTLIAVDQIDAIVSASNSLAHGAGGGNQEQQEAQSIVDALAQGLMDLHEEKRRAVTVISCLEATWKILQVQSPVAVDARYYSPISLRALSSEDVTRGIIEARVAPAYEALGFRPRYSTWPFVETALPSANGLSPRELLRACEEHRQRCIAGNRVTELTTFGAIGGTLETDSPTDGLKEIYERALDAAITRGLMDADGEQELCELLDGTLRLLEKHFYLPRDVDAAVQRDPDQKRPSLHGRLSFIFHGEGDREEHYCFRILGHTQAIAFQTRLRAAMTASGIDTALKFRHLFILRRGDPPGGPKTAALVDQFKRAGGRFMAPADDDLRIFVALVKMQGLELPGFEAWLRRERPLFKSRLFQAAGLCPPPFLVPPTSTNPGRPPDSPPPTPPPPDRSPTGVHPAPTHPPTGSPAETPPASTVAPRQTTPPASSERLIPIGHRYERGVSGAAVTLAADLLPRHVAVLAGPGSGKTVLMRRIVEEAALLGIPSIVLDPNNDLSRLGDAWPARPESWSDEDAAKAQRYHACADVVIWTPGVNAGNPLTLSLLPDFAVIEDSDERNQAIEMARATLSPLLPGSGVKANRMKGVFADVIRRFAAGGGSQLRDLIALLADLPDGISQDSNAPKLASEIADQLRAAIAVNPLLQSAGEPLDPRTMFEGPSGKTRISVINLAGLASDEARDSFVNRLQMSLFTFIKDNPSETGRLYVIDEAQNFVPSATGTACKASAQSLVAQARKYGLGMLFATQTPRGIDSKIVSNCTTHVYGRMGSPATIDAIHEMMAAKGGAADDIGKLSRGEFYFSTDGSTRPFKVRTPLCLSWHPANPPTAEEVVQKARANRLGSA